MTVQHYNAEQSDLLASDFQRRYEPNFALANAIPTFQGTWSGLRGLWCATIGDNSGDLRDFSFQSRTLTQNGAPPFAYAGLVDYVNYNGVNEWHDRADAALSITTGLTIGGWFYVTTAARTEVFMSKEGGVPDIGYQLYKQGSVCRFLVSVDGAATTILNSTLALVDNAWIFVIGRFTASTEMAIFVWDGTTWQKDTSVAAIPAAIFASAANFRIARNQGGNYLDGYFWIGGITPVPLPDYRIRNTCEQTRAALGL